MSATCTVELSSWSELLIIVSLWRQQRSWWAAKTGGTRSRQTTTTATIQFHSLFHSNTCCSLLFFLLTPTSNCLCSRKAILPSSSRPASIRRSLYRSIHFPCALRGSEWARSPVRQAPDDRLIYEANLASLATLVGLSSAHLLPHLAPAKSCRPSSLSLSQSWKRPPLSAGHSGHYFCCHWYCRYLDFHKSNSELT